MTSHQARRREWARTTIRRFRSIRDVHDPEARMWHHVILKQLARIVARPEPELLVSGHPSTYLPKE
jgi:hypothetical protein